MHFLSNVREWCVEFLFPRNSKVLALEAMSIDELLRALPPAQSLEDKNVLALFDYNHPLVKELIWELKYNGNTKVADKLGRILYDNLREEINERSLSEKWHDLVLVPAPISDKRRFERGWNQAELLLDAVRSNEKGNPPAGRFKYLPRQLVKFRHTESQTKTASKHERLANLTNSMKVAYPPSVAGKCVIVIDDVTTTGSTFAEARRALRNAGAKKILCVAIAH